MAHVNDFVGIPWKQGGNDKHGADCWGLTVLVMREVYGIDIKEYNGSKASGDELTNIIESELASEKWQTPTLPKAGDMVMMYDRGTGLPGHMGVFVDNGNVLHSPDHDGSNSMPRTSAIHPIRLLKNVFRKLEFYRYDNCTE